METLNNAASHNTKSPILNIIARTSFKNPQVIPSPKHPNAPIHIITS